MRMDSAEIAQLRTMLRQKQFADVLMRGETLLAAEPGQRDVLISVAIALRYLGRHAESLANLQTLERYHSRFSRLYEERGRCFVDLKDAPQAIAAFEQAVAINHSLPGSWHMLEGLYRMTGQADQAAMAANQLAALRQVPPEVVTAAALFADRDLDAAEQLVRAYLMRHGDQVEAMRLLAGIGIERKVYDDAEILLAAVLERDPGNRLARREYAGVLAELNRHVEARVLLEQLLQEEPDNRDYRALYAYTFVGVGEHERAMAIYQDLLSRTPADAEMHLSIAHAQKTLGHRDEAIASYRKSAAFRPDYGDAYWSLANLKTYRFTDAEIAAMRAMESAASTRIVDRYHLCFALGKAFEDRGEFAESFRFYERGNALKRAESKYRPEIIEANTRRQVEVCTSRFFADRQDWGSPASDPIFIVGLPRSGSTLIEQILASHSCIEGTQELATIQQIVTRLRGRDPDLDDSRYPLVLTQLTTEDCSQLGELYLQATRDYRREAPYFIDKMPNNFRHIGLIHLILPNARIIDARREPMACCFSNFKQLFARGQEFTYSIPDIARYYRTYLELMRYWEQVLPGRILRVQHEDLIDDLDGNVRRLLDFCGVEFEPQCLEFHRTKRSVRTASSEQVRQPIYREGLEQWKNFEQWLGPLRAALGDALDRYHDS
jgi:tetratricopeptide (TPR) repeat protein